MREIVDEEYERFLRDIAKVGFIEGVYVDEIEYEGYLIFMDDGVLTSPPSKPVRWHWLVPATAPQALLVSVSPSVCHSQGVPPW